MAQLERVEGELQTSILGAYVAVSDNGGRVEPCDSPYGNLPNCPYKGKERLCQYPGGVGQAKDGLEIHSGIVVCIRDPDDVKPLRVFPKSL